MRVVNIKDVKSTAMCYAHVEQPMYIYHSVEEFEANVKKPYELIANFADYHNFIIKHNIDLTYNSNNKYVDLISKNVWIKTVDRYIPSTADFSGKIHYVGEETNEPIVTDGCFIQLYYITPTPTRNILFTSSGVHTIGITKWQPTAAQRFNYSQESDPRQGKNKEQIYGEKLEKLIRKRSQTVQMTKILMAMFNPASVHFLNFDSAVKAALPWLKQKDKEKLLQSIGFRRTLMSVLKTLFPELGPAIRKAHKPEDMATKLQEMFDVAKDKKDVKGMLEVFGAILSTGYEETQVVNDLTGAVVPNSLPEYAEPKQVKDMPTDEFLQPDKEEIPMEIGSKTNLTEKEVKDSYPSSLIAMDEDEIHKMLDED